MKYEYEKCFFSIVLLILYYHKMHVQNKREAAFQFMKLLLQYEKCVFKTSGRLLFSLFSYFCNMKKRGLLFSLFSLFSNTKNIRSKQMEAAFQFIKLLLQYEKCAFKKVEATFQFIKLSLLSKFCNTETVLFKLSERLLFSLFSYFCNSEICMFILRGRLLFSLFSFFCQ